MEVRQWQNMKWEQQQRERESGQQQQQQQQKEKVWHSELQREGAWQLQQHAEVRM